MANGIQLFGCGAIGVTAGSALTLAITAAIEVRQRIDRVECVPVGQEPSKQPDRRYREVDVADGLIGQTFEAATCLCQMSNLDGHQSDPTLWVIVPDSHSA